jgi:hypothetical protein
MHGNTGKQNALGNKGNIVGGRVPPVPESYMEAHVNDASRRTGIHNVTSQEALNTLLRYSAPEGNNGVVIEAYKRRGSNKHLRMLGRHWHQAADKTAMGNLSDTIKWFKKNIDSDVGKEYSRRLRTNHASHLSCTITEGERIPSWNAVLYDNGEVTGLVTVWFRDGQVFAATTMVELWEDDKGREKLRFHRSLYKDVTLTTDNVHGRMHECFFDSYEEMVEKLLH